MLLVWPFFQLVPSFLHNTRCFAVEVEVVVFVIVFVVDKSRFPFLFNIHALEDIHI